MDLIEGDLNRDTLAIVEEDTGGTEISRRTYFGVFLIKYEMYHGCDLDVKIKSRIVLSYDWWGIPDLPYGTADHSMGQLTAESRAHRTTFLRSTLHCLPHRHQAADSPLTEH